VLRSKVRRVPPTIRYGAIGDREIRTPIQAGWIDDPVRHGSVLMESKRPRPREGFATSVDTPILIAWSSRRSTRRRSAIVSISAQRRFRAFSSSTRDGRFEPTSQRLALSGYEPRATNSFGGNVQAVSDCSAPASIAECLAWHVARATHRHDLAGRDRKRDRDIASKRRSAGQAIPIRMHTATIRPPDGLRSKRTPLEVRQ